MRAITETSHPFPAFDLPDLDGRRWTHDDLLGRPTVVFCFASWCTCRAQLPAWQHYWLSREREFRMLGVAQEAQGVERILPIAQEYGIEFPILVDQTSALARDLRMRIVPSGFLVDDRGTVRHRHLDDFDIADARVRANVEDFLAGRPVQAGPVDEEMDPAALELFAEGVSAYLAGTSSEALALWRRALARDPDNFLIRSQIWTVENPERFWPVVDRDWQELQLAKEGYDKPLP